MYKDYKYYYGIYGYSIVHYYGIFIFICLYICTIRVQYCTVVSCAGALDIYIGREKRRAFDSKCNRPDGTRNTIVCTVAEAELIKQCRMSKAIQ